MAKLGGRSDLTKLSLLALVAGYVAGFWMGPVEAVEFGITTGLDLLAGLFGGGAA